MPHPWIAHAGSLDPKSVECRPRRFSRSIPRSQRMLQVQCAILDQELEAFVDTGAQVTVMSLECAERCGLLPLVDQRFAGTAVGVGSTRIIGRINNVDLHIGDVVVQSCVTILEDMDLDMLLGMDVLRQGQCEICLRDNVLRFRNGLSFAEVPFMTEDSRSPVVAHVSTEPHKHWNPEKSRTSRRGLLGRSRWRRPRPEPGVSVNPPTEDEDEQDQEDEQDGGAQDEPPFSLAGM